ncbi:MAG: Histone-lysine N-methyltransferase ezh1 [Marteilia pararefringens]
MATRKHRYTPCYHPQEKFRNCTFINCSCIRSGMRCEPACACYKPSYTTLDKEQRSTANDYIYSSRCSNAFIGCCCSEQQCLIESCTCRMKNQECNPKSCSCCTESENGQCGNMMLQKLDAAFSQGKRPFNLPKLQLFSTKSAGYGVKAVEKIMAGQFIQEYVGERIDNNESERRGLICDSEALSYIFNCNEDEAIDSQSYGNISRFINHSNQPNCQTTVLYVNGEDRVAIFAIQNINIGEELNFDYNYSPTHQEIHFSCCN